MTELVYRVSANPLILFFYFFVENLAEAFHYVESDNLSSITKLLASQ